MRKLIITIITSISVISCVTEDDHSTYNGTNIVLHNTSNNDIKNVDLVIKNTKNYPVITEQLGTFPLVKANDSATILIRPKNNIFYKQLSIINSVVRGETDTLEVEYFYVNTDNHYSQYPKRYDFSIKPDESLTGADFFSSIPTVVYNYSQEEVKGIELFIENYSNDPKHNKTTEFLGEIPLVKPNDSAKVLIRPMNKIFYKSQSDIWLNIKEQNLTISIATLHWQLYFAKKFIVYIDKTGKVTITKPTN